MVDVKACHDLGVKAAEAIADKHSNAGNAVEFAADSIATSFRDRNLSKAVLATQTRCGIDLSALLAFEDEADIEKAVAAFVGGALSIKE